MFTLLRFAKKAIENPKILIPVILLIVVAGILEFTVIQGPSNPLPAQEEIKEVTFRHGWAKADAPFKSFPMDKYQVLRTNIEGANRILTSGGGDLVATLHIQMNDGSLKKVKLWEWGLISTEDGMFEGGDDGKSSNLYSVIDEINYGY